MFQSLPIHTAVINKKNVHVWVKTEAELRRQNYNFLIET